MGWVLAIDFGTTATSAALKDGDRVEVVEIGGAARISSAVLATDSGDLVVGDAAETQSALAADRVERTPKRRLGDEVMLLGSRPVRPVEAVAAILRAVADEAIRHQGGVDPSELRLTHPARWGAVRREKLAEAAALAGLPEPVFVPEPVAAAVHFADERIVSGAFVAVYDLGGGTFDTAVLRRSAEGFDVVGIPGGDERLGGEAFDERLFAHVGSRIAAEDPDAWEALRFSTERSWRKAGHDLRVECRRAKEALSANAEYTIYVGAPVDMTVLVSRDELETLIRADVVATVDELEATLQRAGIAFGDLAAVNLVGGSSRIPLVTRLVAERFGQMPQTWGDPKAAVALGAVKATRLTSIASGSGSGSAGRHANRATPLPASIGGCEVIAELGRGGMGVVYLARQASLDRLVAVKTLPILDPGLTDRLRREGAVLAELQHPHVSTVIDVGDDERGTYVVMPYFPGGTVAHVLDHDGRLTPGAAAAVLAAVAEGLAATHGKGFLHRDVKPSNILLSEAGDAYLADFGLALPMLDSSRLTNSRAVLGTAPYTAPEILADETPTEAADTYALGITGYQLVTGQLPFGGSNVLAVLDAVRRGEPTPITELAPDTPPALAELVTSAFAASPADRPQDLRAWAAAVRASADADTVHPAPPATWAGAVAAAAAGADTGEIVPAEVADVVGFQTARRGHRAEDAPAVVPLHPARRRGRVLVAVAAAMLVLAAAVGAAAMSGGGGDTEQIELAGGEETTTTSTSETTTSSDTSLPAADATGSTDTTPVAGPGPVASTPAAGSRTATAPRVTPPPPANGNCVDGRDNDGDGLVDGGDPQCTAATANETNNDRAGCTNGRDDDGDGMADGADPECAAGAAGEARDDRPPRPVVNLTGPTTIDACQRYNWQVSVQNATSGTWVDSDGFTKEGDLFLTDFFTDRASASGEWIRYTARGSGGETTVTINITANPDPRVDYVRSNSECNSVANSGPVL
jgi:tRNA A-37 threonylcarbamoyl transferase component Bud32